MAFKFLGAASVSSLSQPVILDAIKTLFEQTTYPDTTTRTPGSNAAWSVEQELSGPTLVALRLTPPSPNTLGVGVVLAGVDAGSPTPVMCSTYTFGTQRLLGAIFKNIPGSPTYNGWDDAAPYTDADTTGYARLHGSTTIDKIFVFEGPKCIALALSNTGANGPVHFTLLGDFIKTLSAETTEAEIDGNIYGIATTGESAISSNTHNSTIVSLGVMFGRTTSGNNNQAWAFNPGQSTITQVAKLFTGVVDADNLVGLGGSLLMFPETIHQDASSAGRVWGTTKDIFKCLNGKTGQVIVQGATQIGFLVAAFTDSDGNAFFLKAYEAPGE